jgi:hypothetical protein
MSTKRLWQRWTATSSKDESKPQRRRFTDGFNTFRKTDDFAERQVVEDALHALRVLKRDELGFPDWER